MVENNHLTPPTTVLRDLISWFKATEVPGILIGGIAASILATPRLTRDVDSLILLEEDRWGSFISEGARFGFFPRLQDIHTFACRSRVFLLFHEPTGINIDISIGILPFEQECIKRSKWIDVGGFSLPLPTPEDLIVMKAVAHRPRDLVDIESILDTHPDMDLDRVRQWVREFSRVLEMPEIFDDMEKIITKVKKRKKE